MLNILYHLSNKRNKPLKINFHIILFLFLLNLEIINSTTPMSDYQNYPSINDDECFNNILIFDNKKYKSGNFAINNKGDLIIEYYGGDEVSTSRLFYGLTKDGRHLFSNKSSYTYELNIDIDEIIDFSEYYNYYKIYNTRNYFVSVKNDPNKNNQYLFSINLYDFMIELHNLNNENMSHYFWNFNDFFNLNEDDYMFPYEYELSKFKIDSAYIISFIPKFPVNEDIANLSFIKKFIFKSFNEDAYEELSSIKYTNYLNNRIISVILMDDYDFLATISCSQYEEGENVDLRRNSEFGCITKFYNNRLKPLNFAKDKEFFLYLSDNDFLGDIYFKSIYLKNQFALFVYFSRDYYLKFDLFKLNYLNGAYQIDSKVTLDIYNLYDFMSDFVKINNLRLVFICSITFYQNNGNGYNMNLFSQIGIVIIEISPDYTNFIINIQKSFDLDNYIPSFQISGLLYNDYLLLTMTSIPEEELDNSEDEINYFSMLMIFGYPNGTDSTINIEIFLNDIENYISEISYSFYDFLNENLTIENNIFGYIQVDKIKLVSIPDEIIIIEQNNNNIKRILEDESNQFIKLTNNSYLYKENNYFLSQNKNISKSSKYYFIDYQYIVKENNLDQQGPNVYGRYLDTSQEKEYYGRINRLLFKLCHDYCDTCYELGINENEQKCSSCLPKYQYDYWYFYNNTQENCVPEGYYYDIENNNLISCDSNDYIYYYNTTNNKKICFKKEFDCPSSYPYFNETTKNVTTMIVI